jgi:ribosomal protein S18 acetylase RimI-like enzyme
MATTIDQTITYLEMTAPEHLLAADHPSPPLELEPVRASGPELVRLTYLRIGEPHHWISRVEWTPERWREHLERAEVLCLLARVEAEPAGLVELELQRAGEVEITVFGLLPEFVGRGLGGHLLTAAARSAWEARAPGHPRTRRVWLHTSSLDHPHAQRNYERRGFRVFRRVSRPRPIPG